jgi:hypothetical protein
MKKTIVFVIVLYSCFNSFAQFDDVIGKAGSFLNKGLGSKVKRDPITTSFDDCNKNEVMPVNFGKDSLKNVLCSLPFQPGKGYRLQPGFYKASVMSFCLKAGTYGPGSGDGYLFAPLKGPKERLVYKLINVWYNHPEVDQHDLQLILWAIIAKTKINNLSPKLKAVVAILLNENDMNELSKVGLDMLSEEAMKKAVNNLPAPAQKIIEIENQMRAKFYQAAVNYQEIESLAILPGMQNLNSSVERGTWTKLPDGCYIKYLPKGYAVTDIEYYVPYTLTGTEIYYSGPGCVAMPASTGSQRLAQSNNFICTEKETGK